MVSQVAEEDTSVNYYYVDVDQSGELAQQFGVSGIPTLVLVKNGTEAGRKIGYIPAEEIKEFAHQ